MVCLDSCITGLSFSQPNSKLTAKFLKFLIVWGILGLHILGFPGHLSVTMHWHAVCNRKQRGTTTHFSLPDSSLLSSVAKICKKTYNK